MDDDANIAAKLDDVVASGDKFIIGQEGYDFDDRCFRDSYPLSNRSLTQRFGSSLTSERLFGGKFFFNWAMFSMPGHVVLLRSLQHIVELIKLEFRGESAIKMGPADNRGVCCTRRIIHTIHNQSLCRIRIAYMIAGSAWS